MAFSFLDLLVFVFGLCVGSFLNVVIYRLPQGRSIVRPGSFCPHCKQPVRFYDNIPLLSYLVLAGRCRHCRKAVSPRYPAVELLGGLAAVAAVQRNGPTVQAAVIFALLAVLIVISFIDIDHRIIPNVLTLPGIAAGWLFSPWLFAASWQQALILSLAGSVAGGGLLLSVAWGYRLLTGKEGMGGGDVKLLAMIGAFTGWQGVLFTIFAASAAGTVVGLAVMAARGANLKLKIPFGPFLALGAVAYLFFGPQLIAWYFGLL